MDFRQKVLIKIRYLLLFLIVPGELLPQEIRIAATNRVTIASLKQDGSVRRTGLGFLYDANTVICSYSDVKGASQIQVQSGGASASANRLVSFSEAMDLAVLTFEDEIPAWTPIVSSSTVAVGDSVSYWIERNGVWEIARGSVHAILDTTNGYNHILIESRNDSKRSGPLYNANGKIVGWLQGKRAIPMEMIATLAEKQTGEMTIEDVNQTDFNWKFVKPSTAPSSLSFFSLSEMKTVSGPASFSFKLNLPHDWEPKVAMRSGKFHVRYERSAICVEVRGTPLLENDMITALQQAESIVFPDFVRVEMAPYAAESLSGFKATYADMDSKNPYVLHVFYASFSEKLYLLSMAYPKNLDEYLRPLTEQIFRSFRM